MIRAAQSLNGAIVRRFALLVCLVFVAVSTAGVGALSAEGVSPAEVHPVIDGDCAEGLASVAGGLSSWGTPLSPSALTPPETMAYCTVQDVKDAYPEDRLREITTGEYEGVPIDDEKLQKAIDSYGDYIRMHVTKQHPSNPFDETHDYLNALNVEGAFLTVKSRSETGLSDAEQRIMEQKDTILGKIASGAVPLMSPEDEVDAEDGTLLDKEDLFDKPQRRFNRHRDPNRFPVILGC